MVNYFQKEAETYKDKFISFDGTNENFAEKEFKTEDFQKYIETKYLQTNKHNFQKLKELNLLKYYRDFNSDFRGNIQKMHTIGDINILETDSKSDRGKFYIIGKFSNVFSTLNEAVLYAMYDGRYFDTLTTLLKTKD